MENPFSSLLSGQFSKIMQQSAPNEAGAFPDLIFNKAGQALKWENGRPVTFADLKKDPGRVMVSIIRQQSSQYAKGIRELLVARESAANPANPMRQYLYEIYKDLERDPFVHGQVYNQRISAIKNKAFKVADYSSGTEDPDKTDLLKRAWFFDFIRFALESIVWGHSLVYVAGMNEKQEVSRIKLVFREHVKPELGLIVASPTDDKGQSYLRPPYSNYTVPIGDENDLGLYDKAAALWIFKKHSWQNWDEFEEMFGVPLRIAKTTSTDQRVRSEMKKWLENMGSAGFGIFDEDTTLEIKENKATDAFSVFNEKRKAVNEELAILFNGQTMTSMNGSSRSQGEVHERMKGDIEQDDMRFLYFLVNDQLMPLLTGLGYPFGENDIFNWDESEQLSTEKKLLVFQGVANMGFELDPEQVTEEFGVRILGKKEAPTAPLPDPDDKGEKPDPKKRAS